MPDRVAYPLLAFVAAGLVALGFVWPQGRGAVSPAPFGHPLGAVSPLEADVHTAANLITGFGPTTYSVPTSPLKPAAKPEPKPPAAP